MNPYKLPRALAEQQQQRSGGGNHRTLDLADAWKLAARWRVKLHFEVRLDDSGSDYEGLTPGYGWVRFDLSRASQKEVSLARAASLAWFALSCCAGYGGRENPVFWKCLLGSVRYADNTNANILSVSDAYDIIDGPGTEFPRFRLQANANSDFWKEDRITPKLRDFCGLPGEALPAADAECLEATLVTLSPYIIADRAARRPAVSVVVYDTSRLSNGDFSAALAKALVDSNDPSTTGIGVWQSRTFPIKQIQPGGGYYTWPWALHLSRMDQLRHAHDVELTGFQCEKGNWIARDRLAEQALDVLRVNGRNAFSRFTSLFLAHKSLRIFPAFASALPLTRTLRAVRLTAGFTEQSRKGESVWLGYALFHPDAASSSWTRLDLENTGMGDHTIPILQAMARGNNVAALLQGRDPTGDGYYTATLAAGTEVFDQPAKKFDTVPPSEPLILMTSDGSTPVDVCDVNTVDVSQWNEWIAVVVPGYGLGYARSAHVTKVDKRPPSEAMLTRLRISHGAHRVERCTNDLAALLPLLGRRLVHLDISGYRHFDSTDDFMRALSCCPLLETLAITDDGGLWSDPECHRVVPKLRELQLRLVTSLSPMMVVPWSLRVLRIKSLGREASYGRSVDAVRSILTQESNLRLFHWHETTGKGPGSYAATRETSAKRVGDLGLPPGCWSWDPASGLPASSVVAFLSAISHKELSSSVTKLDEEAIKAVLNFARGSRLTVWTESSR